MRDFNVFSRAHQGHRCLLVINGIKYADNDPQTVLRLADRSPPFPHQVWDSGSGDGKLAHVSASQSLGRQPIQSH